jgi:hypothetical protein
MGKGQERVHAALADIREQLPFALKGIDSDNGSEFINHHLARYCRALDIQFTRGRPYKKDDNAHIEQKNWTHVRKIRGWERYDSEAVLAAMNRLYAGDLRLLQNLFLPSVKLREKVRVGSRLVRRYDAPRTPLERVASCTDMRADIVTELQRQRDLLDPFALSRSVNAQIDRIYALANRRHAPKIAQAASEDATASDGKAVDAPTDARPQAFPQSPGPLGVVSNGRTEDQSQEKKTATARKAPPTPSRAKPVDGSSKHKRKMPPTGFRRRSGGGRMRSLRSARALPLVARISHRK